MNKQYLSPYVNFQGRAREAMDFYQGVLGGKVDLQEHGGRVAMARLDADGAVIVGSDGHPDYPAKVGENVAIAVRGSDPERMTSIYHGLAEGGQAKMAPSDKSPGFLLDKFGINWVVLVERA
jgi:PhnB protein